ncbi:hypothetical protein B0O80DRAFT_447123 [Mortierella sp. GBAus27b]|nr:hypothetical protein BGX31_000609 [Mortierella sp. GBA43]KAI8356306.1 hypothetical protein B0O80DRAFT_447123 [Mortierella sp. GBAus27b]
MPRKTAVSKKAHDRGYKDNPDDTFDDDDFYGMRELKHQLAGMNLQLKDTIGDGNCLFRACSDQFFGGESNHATLRAEVCQYIEDHEEHFKFFLDNVTVQAHVALMRKNGTYGGNVELVAFARMKKVDIKVYQPGYIYVIEGVDVKKEGSGLGQRPVMHIAYHTWEHYSSIRNMDGPHEGPPQVNPRKVEQEPLRKLTNRDSPRSIERAIMKVSGINDLELVRELLEKYNGDVDSVYNEIYAKTYPEAHADEDGEKEPDASTLTLSETPKEPEGESPKDQKNHSTEDQESKQTDGQDQDGSDTGADTQDPSTGETNPTLPQQQEESPEPNTNAAAAAAAESPAKEKATTGKKRISSREKKELAKRNQKLNKKNRGKQDTNSSGSHASENNSKDAPMDPGKAKAMRELFV